MGEELQVDPSSDNEHEAGNEKAKQGGKSPKKKAEERDRVKKRNASKTEEKPPEPVLKPGSEQLKKIHQSLRWHPLDPGGAGGVPYVFNLYFHLVSAEACIGTRACVSYLSSCAFQGASGVSVASSEILFHPNCSRLALVRVPVRYTSMLE